MSFDGLVRPAAAKAPAAPENSEELLQKLQSSDPPNFPYSFQTFTLLQGMQKFA